MSKVTEWRATMSSRGQVKLPAEVRARLGLVQGSVLRFVVDEEGIRLLPQAGDVRRLKGRLPARAKPVTLMDMNRAVAARRATVAKA